MRPIILALGPVPSRPDAIVLDHDLMTLWLGTERVPTPTGAQPRWGHRGGKVWFRVVSILLVRAPGVVTLDEIVEHVWGDDESGGPGDARGVVRIVGYQRQPTFKWLGLALVGRYGVGYQVLPIEEAKQCQSQCQRDQTNALERARQQAKRAAKKQSMSAGSRTAM